MKYPNNNIDTAPDAGTLEFLYGIHNNIGYITICIDWVYIQYKIDSAGHVFIRGKFGGNGWTGWSQI